MILDVTKVAPKLYIGSAPPEGYAVAQAGFDTLVLCAKEYQPPDSSFPGVKVIRCPIDDAELTPLEATQVRQASRLVAGELARGRRVLVTCQMGRNRSGLVLARALMKVSGAPASVVVPHIQYLRRNALTNRSFVRALWGDAVSRAA